MKLFFTKHYRLREELFNMCYHLYCICKKKKKKLNSLLFCHYNDYFLTFSATTFHFLNVFHPPFTSVCHYVLVWYVWYWYEGDLNGFRVPKDTHLFL